MGSVTHGFLAHVFVKTLQTIVFLQISSYMKLTDVTFYLKEL